MRQHLLVSVHLTHDRYHGASDWPPSPARVFQALVAGAAKGGTLTEGSVDALRWLELQAPPIIAAPHVQDGQPVLLYVPNNDLDAVGGDIRRVADLRVGKLVEPRLTAPGVPLLYAWPFEPDAEAEARVLGLQAVVERLYQLGRGVDMAWARAEVLDDDALAARLASYEGVVHRPTPGGSGSLALACPQPGSLASLQARFAALGRRFSWHGAGKKASLLFTQPPKARFAEVSYDSPMTHHLFDLRDPESPSAFKVWQFHRAHDLVVAVRDRVAERLGKVFANLRSEIEQVIVGRANDRPALPRVRFVPLPSIGHEHVDRAIRRVLVQVPSDCVFSPEDVRWAVAGIEATALEGCAIVPATDDKMLGHYGVGTREGFRAWQSVTPVALPESAARRRIEPTKRADEAKGGAERAEEETRARASVAQALRHAGLRERVVSMRLQREPFERRGRRAEAFAEGTRFAKERLWHLAIEFDRPISGPLVLGDGRYLGLGVMEPTRAAAKTDGLWALDVVSGLAIEPSVERLTRALRRAVMARAQAALPAGEVLPLFFSGHEPDGERASQGHEHLAFAYDSEARRFWIVAPHRLAHRPARGDEHRWFDLLRVALTGLEELKAGAAGLITLRAASIDPDAELLDRSRAWESLTPYVVTRHVRGTSAHAALIADVQAECARIGLPRVDVDVVAGYGKSGVGLVGILRLRFASSVAGPLVLGRTRHLGGGVFRPRSG